MTRRQITVAVDITVDEYTDDVIVARQIRQAVAAKLSYNTQGAGFFRVESATVISTQDVQP